MATQKRDRLTLTDYKKLFDIPTNGMAPKEGKAANALAVALDIRKFEIDLYWKRAAYFWAFIAVTFAGYFSLLSSKEMDSFEKQRALLIVSCLGIVFSVAWYFVNRASKRWQENWEKHVDLLEDAVNGPIYKTVVSDPKTRFIDVFGPFPFSVSKVNQTLSLFIVLVFIIITGNILSSYKYFWPDDRLSRVIIGLTIITLSALGSRGGTGEKDQEVHIESRSTTIA